MLLLTVILLPYEPGEPTAVELRGGRDINRHAIKTPDSIRRLSLKPDKQAMNSQEDDLLFVDVELVDSRAGVIPSSTKTGQCMRPFRAALISSRQETPPSKPLPIIPIPARSSTWGMFRLFLGRTDSLARRCWPVSVRDFPQQYSASG